jgi:hypothetical protein
LGGLERQDVKLHVGLFLAQTPLPLPTPSVVGAYIDIEQNQEPRAPKKKAVVSYVYLPDSR